MKSIKTILLILLFVFIILFLVRLLSPKEIDDIHPLRNCENEYIQKAEILWVMPKYLNTPISENQTWCQEILSLNKTLGMHGIYHSYHEFKFFVNESELQEAKKIFEDCFGYEPTLFKPPYLKLSKENKIMLEENNLIIKKFWNQNTHKVYHCQDSGYFPNWFHNIF